MASLAVDAGMTFLEAMDHSLTQLRAMAEAGRRREARLGLIMMNAVRAADGSIHCGRKGHNEYVAFAERLKKASE